MAQFNVHQAKTHFSKLLDQVLEGETILITRNGEPVAEIIPARKKGLVIGAGKDDPNVNHAIIGNDWWKPMTDEEAEAFVRGE